MTKHNLGWNIYKRKEENGLLQVRFLCHNDVWKLDRGMARVFYNKEDALSALVIMKAKDGKDTD